MTYLEFHLAFILPPILVLWFAGPRPQGRMLLGIALMALVALVYTTPWDNFLVWRGVWGYSDGRVLGVIGYVPLEEYAFFVLQTVLTGLFAYRLWQREPGTAAERPIVRLIGGGVYTLCAAVGLLAAVVSEPTLYAGLILGYFAPPLLLQWAVGGDVLWALRRHVALAIAIPSVYLWGTDRIAIELGIWRISTRYTTGWHLVGLPVEEALFFLVVNVAIVQGLFLLWHPQISARLFPRAASAAREPLHEV